MIKKLLILASWYPSDESPLNGIFVQEQAALLSSVYDVAILVPRLVRWQEIIKERKWAPPIELEERSGLQVYRTNVLPPFPNAPLRLRYWTYMRGAVRGFNLLLRDWGKPDIIHAHVVLPGGWAAVRLGQQRSIPVALTEHTSPFSFHLRTSLERRMVFTTLAAVDKLVAVSPALAGQITSFVRKGIRVKVIGNLIKTRYFVPPEPTEQTGSKSYSQFLFVGGLSAQKGLSYLIEAFHFLLERGNSSFRLLIGGDGPERANIESLVRKYGLAGNCCFLGALTQEQVLNWMQQSDVFVLPSLHETFGIVLGEAMACGKPVIATRCGGPEFVVTPETGVLVPPADTGALADALQGFMSGQYRFDPQVIRESIQRRFGEEAFLEKIARLYEEMASVRGNN